MIANHIHDALAQVRELQKNILDKQRFKGYSGRARAIAGSVALVGLRFSQFPRIRKRLKLTSSSGQRFLQSALF